MDEPEFDEYFVDGEEWIIERKKEEPMNDTTRKLFFEPVLAAMQSAEEIGGPEGAEYIALMTAISDEAIICDDCKKEADEIHRTRTDGVKQCYDCYIGEEGPQT